MPLLPLQLPSVAVSGTHLSKLVLSIDYVAAAWQIRERSADPGGLPLVYWLKTLIPIMAASIFLQGFAELLRNALVLSAPREETVERRADD